MWKRVIFPFSPSVFLFISLFPHLFSSTFSLNLLFFFSHHSHILISPSLMNHFCGFSHHLWENLSFLNIWSFHPKSKIFSLDTCLPMSVSWWLLLRLGCLCFICCDSTEILRKGFKRCSLGGILWFPCLSFSNCRLGGQVCEKKFWEFKPNFWSLLFLVSCTL